MSYILLVKTYGFIHRLLAASKCPTSIFGRACAAKSDDARSISPNRRDLFPLPHLGSLVDCGAPAHDDLDSATLLAFVNASIDALNHWYGYKPRTIAPGYHNTVQKCCMRQWVSKACSLLVALGKMLPEDLVARPPTLTTLDASKVDVLDHCGDIDTVAVLSTAVASAVTDGPSLFPHITPDHAKLPRYSGNIRDYARLVIRQLRAQRLRLRLTILGGGPCFFISKPGKDALRHLWNGKFVSDACLPAPGPRHLANPSTFVALRASRHRPLYLSTRDCRSWFEQFRAPVALRPFFGQQPIKGSRLIGVLGLSIAELRGFLEDLPSPFTDEHLLSLDLFSVSCTWPQGFSWSPYIVQEKLLHLARLGGFGPDAILSPDRFPTYWH